MLINFSTKVAFDLTHKKRT